MEVDQPYKIGEPFFFFFLLFFLLQKSVSSADREATCLILIAYTEK